ncbi:MAG: hypothetical protein M1570_04720 [Chloroflexi bacterium]|nr:hypothetical protein [Chloroflexota bacterium]
MPSTRRSILVLVRFALTALALVPLFGIVGCSGSATPTRPAATQTATTGAPLPTVPLGLPTAEFTALPTGVPLPTSTLAVLGPTPAVTTTVPPGQATGAATSRPVPVRSPTSRPAVSGGRIAYSRVVGATPNEHTIWIANVNGTNAHQVLMSAMWPAFSPDGRRLAFYQMSIAVTNPGLYIANSDGGNPAPVFLGSGVCCIDWSRDGKWLVYVNSPRPSQPTGPISMVKVDGYYKTFVDLKVQGNDPSFSPDGSQLVFSGCMPNTHSCGVLVTRTDGSGFIRQVTNDNGGNARWSPVGNRIVYQVADGAGHHQVSVVNADGTGRKQLTNGNSHDGQPTWSRDGGSIFWRSDQNGTAWAIYVMNADGSNPRRIISDAFVDPNLWGWESMSVGP